MTQMTSDWLGYPCESSNEIHYSSALVIRVRVIHYGHGRALVIRVIHRCISRRAAWRAKILGVQVGGHVERPRLMLAMRCTSTVTEAAESPQTPAYKVDLVSITTAKGIRYCRFLRQLRYVWVNKATMLPAHKPFPS